MLQELASKLLDIYIALVTGLICTVIGLMLDRCLKSRSSEAQTHSGPSTVGLTLTQVTQISIEIRDQPSAKGANEFTALVISTACISYLWFREDILDTALLLTLGMVGLWFGVVLHSLYAGYLRGWQWMLYMLGMIAFSIGAIVVISTADSPAIAPRYFGQWQAFAHAQGLRGFVGWWKSGLLTALDIAWFIAHVSGVAVLFVALRDAALSMFFYAAASSGRLRGDDSASWCVRAAARYASPLRTLVTLMVLLILAYYLVNGQLIVWFARDFPIWLQDLVHSLMFGDRGR